MPRPLLTPDYYFNFFTNFFIDIMFKFILFITRIRLLDLCVTEHLVQNNLPDTKNISG